MAIMQKLLLHTLIEASADCVRVEIEGPLLTALKQWGNTIALEEESNTFRDYLLQLADEVLVQLKVENSRDTIIGIRRVSDALYSGYDVLILGVLKWVLTSAHKREQRRYPTRSIRIWIAASIISQLGFTISAANWTVRDRKTFDKAMESTVGDNNTYDVFLVSIHRADPIAASACDTKLEMVFAPNEIPVPRTMWLRDIPATAFKHVDAVPQELFNGQGTIAYLENAYNYAFDMASRSFKSMKVESFIVKIELEVSSKKIVFQDLTKALFTPFRCTHLVYVFPFSRNWWAVPRCLKKPAGTFRILIHFSRNSSSQMV